MCKGCAGPSSKIVIVGGKRPVNYLLAALVSLRSSSYVILRGRGRSVSKVVHIANIAKQLKLADIIDVRIGEDELVGRGVSMMEVVMRSKIPSGPARAPLLGATLDGMRELKLSEVEKLRAIALRRGVYYSALPFEDRLLISWALKAIRGKVRSAVLAGMLREALMKLAKALMRKFLGIFGHVIGTGVRRLIACTKSLGSAIGLALAWGCDYAMRWARDLAFIKGALGGGLTRPA